MLLCPQDSVPGHRIEIFGAADTDSGIVVVSSQTEKAAVAADVRAFVWICVISNNVAQTDDLLHALLVYVLQYSLEGLQIGVYIANYGIAHPVAGSLPDLPKSNGVPLYFRRHACLCQ
jgi:hypothetical protein